MTFSVYELEDQVKKLARNQSITIPVPVSRELQQVLLLNNCSPEPSGNVINRCFETWTKS
jgi:hypothetical protein